MSTEIIVGKSLLLLEHAVQEQQMPIGAALTQAFTLGGEAYAQAHALSLQHTAKFEKAFFDVAYELGAERNPEPEIVLAALKARLNNGNKLHDKIREAFQANYRAALNLLSSMTAEERSSALSRDVKRISHDHYARLTARQVCIETWGDNAVEAALGSGS
jgi:hypothetical protein